MYFYFYDSFLQEKRYIKKLAEIEGRLIDLMIQGKIIKLNILSHIKELIYSAVRAGAETVVVLGDDKTISQAIASVVDLDITLGIIPLGRKNSLGKLLGIPKGLKACEILAKRIKERIDVAKVSGNYFAFCLKALSPYIKIFSPDNQYCLSLLSPKMEAGIYNFKPRGVKLEAKEPASFFIPQDGYMELVVKDFSCPIDKILFKKKGELGNYTILPFKHIRLEPSLLKKDVRLLLDGYKIIKAPVEIEVLAGKISVIVGRERQF